MLLDLEYDLERFREVAANTEASLIRNSQIGELLHHFFVIQNAVRSLDSQRKQ
jgi:hypothetical protein